MVCFVSMDKISNSEADREMSVAANGVAIDYEQAILDPTNVPYARLITVGLNLGAVANGVPFDKTIASGITRAVAHPEADHALASWTLTEKTLETQSDLYRLNGDYNPLHIGECILGSEFSAWCIVSNISV